MYIKGNFYMLSQCNVTLADIYKLTYIIKLRADLEKQVQERKVMHRILSDLTIYAVFTLANYMIYSKRGKCTTFLNA